MPAEKPKPPADGGEHEKLRTLGKYLISKRLGAGGMGAVFLATDTELRRPVALKVLPKDRAENPTLVKRFKSEAQAVAQLRHDGIVAIYETGQIDGFPYLALEFVDGQDLQSIIEKRGPIPPKRSLKIIRQVAEALQHAYERNIVHRDIKPSNLLVQVDGTCKLTDFGLARSVDDELDAKITKAGTTVGTVDYISPEQAVDSKAADVRSDIYSLGCTWYHMLTGEPPFPDGNLQNKLHGHIRVPPPDPRSLNANVPEAYVAVIHRMMAKKPQDRYQTPAELLADLDQVAGAASQISAQLFDDTPTSPSGRSGRRHGTAADDETPVSTRRYRPPEELQQSQPSAGSQPRQPRPEAADPNADAPVSKVDPRLKGRGAPPRQPSAPRSRVFEDDDSAAGATSAAESSGSDRSRKLPPRERPVSPGLAIDLDMGRIALIGLIVAGGVGLFWFAFSRGGAWGLGSGATVQDRRDPALHAEQPVIVQPPAGQPNPDAPQAPVVAAVVATPTPAPAASSSPAFVLAGDAADVARTGPPVPGAEDLAELQSASARELLPDWVFAVRNAGTEGLPVTVLDSASRMGAPVTIDAAAQASAAPERIVELRGNGPFVLKPVVIRNCQRLIVRAAAGGAPVILLEGSPDDAQGRGYLHLGGGVLVLEGVHVLSPATGLQTPRTLFSVEGGTLILRNCSVTVPDTSGPTVVAAAREARGIDFASRILIERCLLRGRRATAISGRGAHVDLIVAGSLLTNEAVPLLTAEFTAAEAATSGAHGAPPALTVRVLGSTLWTAGDAFELTQRPSGTIPRSVVQLRRSILAGGGESATMLDLPAWPGRATSLSGQPRIAGLNWRLEHCWLPGWKHLVRLGDSAASTEADWQSFWAAPLESLAVSGDAPPAPERWETIDGERTAEWSSHIPPEIAGGVRCGAEQVPVPPSAQLDRLLLFASRPQLPAGFETLTPAAAPPLRFDLRTLKDNLNDLLNSPQVPDGSHVQLSGVGLVALPPLRFRNRTLRLECLHSAEGAAFTLRPELPAGPPPEAVIVVEGGRLDLIGFRLQESPSKTRETSPRLLLVRDADFTLRNCYFEGGVSPSRTGGLIEWVQSSGPAARGSACIVDCQLMGQQPLLAADIDRRLLVLSNNLFASRSDGLVLRVQSPSAPVDQAQAGWVIADHNTVLFGGAGLQLLGQSTGRQEQPLARIMATANVFAPAPGAALEEVVLLRHPEAMQATGPFDWWESRNGYAPALKRWRISAAVASPAAPGTQDWQRDWVEFWGSEHVEAPWLGVNGVLMATVLTSLKDLSPPMAALSKSCTGATGDAQGGAIGIRPLQVGPLGRAPTPAAPAGLPAGTNSPQPAGRRPDF